MILSLRFSLPCITRKFDSSQVFRNTRSVVVCAAKGPRPRYPRVWKSKNRIGTISKSAKLVDCIKELSNVKEEVYGALDSFIAWELEFPLITVKKALKTLEYEKQWKRIIQVTKWMLSKGQGRTNGSYFMLLNALEQDDRLGEAEELWEKLFSDNLEATPRIFFDKMISIYYKRGLHDKMFEVFADMEELGMRPTITTTNMVGEVFKQLGMVDKYEKLVKKYPPPKWEYRYIKGKRVRIKANQLKDTYTMPRLTAGNGNEVVDQQLKEDDDDDKEIESGESNSSDPSDDDYEQIEEEEELHEFVDDIQTVSA